MPMLLDLDTLAELYPVREGRNQFLQRALQILREDREALQGALRRHAYAQAGELAHRLQGSAAFLTGDPEQCAAILLPLEQAARQGLARAAWDALAHAVDQLITLESAIEQAIRAD